MSSSATAAPQATGHPSPGSPNTPGPQPGMQSATGTQPLPNHFNSLFLLFYRHGMNATLTKGFFHSDTSCGTQAELLLSARTRAQKHCKIMGYHFIFVRPMVCAFDSEEMYKLTGREGEITP